MKTILKTEEALKFIISYWLSLQLGFQWWTFLAWLIAPDIGILAYTINTRVGAIVYNAFHHQGLAIVVGLAGVYAQSRELEFAGLLLFGHSSMDRALGFGLKYPDNFKNTHLGWVGKTHSSIIPPYPESRG